MGTVQMKHIKEIIFLLKESIEGHKKAMEQKDFKLTEQYLGEKNAYWKVLNIFGYTDQMIKMFLE
jgi:hypothetical protein